MFDSVKASICEGGSYPEILIILIVMVRPGAVPFKREEDEMIKAFCRFQCSSRRYEKLSSVVNCFLQPVFGIHDILIHVHVEMYEVDRPHRLLLQYDSSAL